MKTEFEATFENINKAELRSKLKEVNAKLINPERMLKRVVFHLPQGHEIQGGWARVRDEGDKVTMSIKAITGSQIHEQKEVCLVIDDFESGLTLLRTLGCKDKAYQETKRESWVIDDVQIEIDEWPFLEPYLEIEGPSEGKVKEISELLGFDYSKALFCPVTTLYNKKYGVSEEVINNKTPRIVFNEENPFI